VDIVGILSKFEAYFQKMERFYWYKSCMACQLGQSVDVVSNSNANF
jgi:hypothetical protein